ncbi:MAG: enoyl-CoA hydratase-related protein [Acidiferrobacterales bacterium]|nr:enoyl-CoA hydratase-related protein [Acidiferrobacterales bacterium]
MKPNQYDTLLVESVDAHIAVVTLNRPEISNAFNTRMACELYGFFEDLNADDSKSRCIILTGAGERAFCAGADLKERREMRDEQWTRQHLEIERMVRAIHDCPIPIVGAVNGAAFGGGCEIACLADFLYAAETARFALPETSLGIIPGAGGTQTLPRTIGEKRAKEIILSGRAFTATEALAWGLVNKVLPQDQLMPAAMQVAQKIAENAPIAVRQAKKAIRGGLHMTLSDGLEFELESYYQTVPTRDRREGMLAFNEKREPRFKGR